MEKHTAQSVDITYHSMTGADRMKPQQYEAHVYASSMPPDGKSRLRIIRGCYAIVRYLVLMDVDHCLGCHEEPTDDFLTTKNSQTRLPREGGKEVIHLQGACCMVLDALESDGTIRKEWNRGME